MVFTFSCIWLLDLGRSTADWWIRLSFDRLHCQTASLISWWESSFEFRPMVRYIYECSHSFSTPEWVFPGARVSSKSSWSPSNYDCRSSTLPRSHCDYSSRPWLSSPYMEWVGDLCRIAVSHLAYFSCSVLHHGDDGHTGGRYPTHDDGDLVIGDGISSWSLCNNDQRVKWRKRSEVNKVKWSMKWSEVNRKVL